MILETIEGIREETGERLPLEVGTKGLGTTRKTLSAIINGRQGVTPEMAIKLAAGLGSTAEFWIRAQEHYALFQARKKVATRHIRVFWKSAAAAL